MMGNRLAVILLVAAALVAQTGTAAASHLLIGVSGPEEVIVGEELEITAVVRTEDDAPVENAEVEFFANSFFAGVTGEIRLGSTTTNSLGIATFPVAFNVRGVHRVRVEVTDADETQEAEVIVGVNTGPQIVSAEAGIDIPGFGSWLVTTVIGFVWLVMIIAAVWMVRVYRSGRPDGAEPAESPESPRPGAGKRRGRRRRPGVNVALTATSIMVLLAIGLMTLLIRSPDTHHNFDPEGYSRSPVAYLDAAYVYPGPGLADGDILSGDAVADGRALFLKTGCAGCHGLDGQGAASASSPAFATRQWLGTVVRTGLPGGMPAYAEVDLTDAELDLIHAFLLDARDVLADEVPVVPTTVPSSGGGTASPAPTFATVRQILQSNCGACHGTAGGWSAADHDAVINSGDNGPAVIPGDPDGSVLAQKLLGTQTFGTIMPPAGPLSDSDIRTIVDWIEDGAPS